MNPFPDPFDSSRQPVAVGDSLRILSNSMQVYILQSIKSDYTRSCICHELSKHVLAYILQLGFRSGPLYPDTRTVGMEWEEQHEPRFQAILSRVRDAGDDLSVVDVGARPYHLTSRLACLDNVKEVVPIDLEECNVERDPWPVQRDMYDVIVMGAILEHLFHPAYALHQARNAVRHAGRLILSTPNGLSLKTRIETLTGRETPTDGLPAPESSSSLYDRHQHEYSRGELHDLLNKTGWYCLEGDIEGIQLARNGTVGRLYERIGGSHPTLADQWVVDCHAGRRALGTPDVYRESVIEHASPSTGNGIESSHSTQLRN